MEGRVGGAAIEVRPVGGARERRLFAEFPWRVHRGDPLWVPPLLPDRLKALDRGQGEFFSHGEAEFYLAWRDGEVVGTVCVGEDFAANGDALRRGLPRDAVFGFLDFVDDLEVFRSLVAACASWARPRGLDTLFGPFNLDYENAYGVLVEGRDRPPALLCGHTPPWYLSAYEALGFRPARGDNIAFEVRLDRPLPGRDRLARLAETAKRRSGFTVRSADLSRFDREVDNVHSLLTRGLAHLDDFKPWERSFVEALLAPFRKYADEDHVLFAERDGEVIGFLPAIPNLNEAIAGLRGLRSPLDYLRVPFAFHRKWECVTVKSILVLPEYWSTGLVAVLFDELLRRLEGAGFSWMDLSLTSEDNPATPAMAAHFGGRIYKRYRTFRKELPSA